MIFRRRRPPAELRPPLAPDERVVGWARAEAGGGVVASTAGLYLPGAEQRVGWHEIHRATWSGRTLTVVAGEQAAQREGYAVTADLPPVTVHLPEPGDLPRVVRSRVTRSVAYSAHHRLPGGGVRVVARRVPGIDGLTWAVRYDPGTDPDGPGVPEATGALVAAARAAQQPAG